RPAVRSGGTVRRPCHNGGPETVPQREQRKVAVAGDCLTLRHVGRKFTEQQCSGGTMASGKSLGKSLCAKGLATCHPSHVTWQVASDIYVAAVKIPSGVTGWRH